jgi:hypothetical protein
LTRNCGQNVNNSSSAKSIIRSRTHCSAVVIRGRWASRISLSPVATYIPGTLPNSRPIWSVGKDSSASEGSYGSPCSTRLVNRAPGSEARIGGANNRQGGAFSLKPGRRHSQAAGLFRPQHPVQSGSNLPSRHRLLQTTPPSSAPQVSINVMIIGMVIGHERNASSPQDYKSGIERHPHRVGGQSPTQNRF